MSFKVTVTIILGMLLIAGCPKQQQQQETATDDGTQSTPKLVEEASGEAPVESTSSALGPGGMTDEQREQYHAALLSAGESLGLTYVKASDRLQGDGIPEPGVVVASLVDKCHRIISGSKIEVTDSVLSKVAETVVKDVMPRPADQTPEPSAKPAEEYKDPLEQANKNATKGRPQIDKSELKVAKQILGDWKSIKEIHSRFTAQHDDQYYEFVNIANTGKMLIKVYREGEVMSNREFGYTFNADTGEIKLKDESGSVVNSITAYNKGDDDKVLYLEYKSGTIKVYKQVGTVGVPPPDDGSTKVVGAPDKDKNK